MEKNIVLDFKADNTLEAKWILIQVKAGFILVSKLGLINGLKLAGFVS